MRQETQNSNQETGVPSAIEAASWIESGSKIKTFTCHVFGRSWGVVMSARSVAKGAGWNSSLAGFFPTLEEAQQAHLDAIHTCRKAQQESQAKPAEQRPYVEPWDVQKWRRLNNRVSLDRNMLRLKKMEERQSNHRA